VEFTLRDAHFTKVADEGTSLGRQWEKCQGFTLRGWVANESANAEWRAKGVLRENLEKRGQRHITSRVPDDHMIDKHRTKIQGVTLS
jgi:hypothetical protein